MQPGFRLLEQGVRMAMPEFDTVRVELDARSYDVLIGPGLVDHAEQHIVSRLGDGARAFVITDENVGAAHLDRLCAALGGQDRLRGTLALPAGESTKCFAEIERVCSALLTPVSSAVTVLSRWAVALSGTLAALLPRSCGEACGSYRCRRVFLRR